jgi:pimeloyl-ACP methyl ester carboxylesterase
VVSSFASLNDILDDVLKRHIPKQFPKQWVQLKPALYFYMDLAQSLQGKPAVSHIRPSDWAKQVHIPTLIVHGDHDHFISPDQGKTLYDTIDSPYKRWLTVPGGGHSNVLATTMPLYAEMNSWLIKSLQRLYIAHN